MPSESDVDRHLTELPSEGEADSKSGLSEELVCDVDSDCSMNRIDQEDLCDDASSVSFAPTELSSEVSGCEQGPREVYKAYKAVLVEAVVQ